MVENCVFCKIVSGEFDSAKVYEDRDFLAILDIQPNAKGMTVLMTKKHYDSYLFEMPEDEYKRFLSCARKVARLLEKGLGVYRVAMVMEGMGVNHAHLKLYPLHGVSKDWKPTESDNRMFFERYPGYVSTQYGPKKELAELKKLAETLRARP